MKVFLKLTPEIEKEIIELFPHYSNRKIAYTLSIDEKAVIRIGKRLRLKKTQACKSHRPNATNWTPEMLSHLTANFHHKSNAELAKALDLRLTVVRNKTRELGLVHIEMQYWTPEEHEYLVANYKTVGDVELAEAMQQIFPRVKKWTKKHICKRRGQQGLRRSAAERAYINQKYLAADARLFKSDLYVANFISRDPAVKNELLKVPEIVDLKRAQLILNRTINRIRDGK